MPIRAVLLSWMVNDGTLNSTTQEITTVNLSGGPTTDTLFQPHMRDTDQRNRK